MNLVLIWMNTSMAEALYDLSNDLSGSEHSTSSERVAVLAREALANHLRTTTPISAEWIAETSGSQGLDFYPRAWQSRRDSDVDTAMYLTSLQGGTDTYSKSLFADPLTHEVMGFQGLTSLGRWTAVPAESEVMSSDQYLVFLSMGQKAEFLRPIISRIEELSRFAVEEEDQYALRRGSLQGLLRFLYLHRARIESRPQLILTSEGHLRAIWRKSKDHRVAIRFMDHATVAFVTFLPDRVRPTRINRIGGESSVESFFACAGLEKMVL